MSHLINVKHTMESLTNINADAYLIGMFEDGSMTPKGKSIDGLISDQISAAFKRKDIKGKL